ncbi:MAG: NAD(P)/FAD-dependent oxidoreductase [Crocinitomicaceae bacterium]
MNVAIIGGGAAGFFAAIAAKENFPDAKVTIYEKSQKLLSKVKISGGGRCNVTNGCTDIKELALAYPRGGKKLRKAFGKFNTLHTMEWFESRGIPLVIQDDNCVFPVSQDSQSIIDCFFLETKRLGINIEIGCGVKTLLPKNQQWKMDFINSSTESEIVDKIIIATGGSPKRSGLEWLENMGHQIEEPVPSLFTFNMPNEPVKELMGIVIEDVSVNIQGTQLKSSGPLLITHWGMSGPAILKLSAFGARTLSEKKYGFNLQVNWVHIQNSELVADELRNICEEHANKKLSNYRPYALKERLWIYLIEKCEFTKEITWSQIGKKGINKLMNILTNDVYEVKGKTTFKEEFVTCGGISLDNINFKTMQSNICPNIYFAGELLDIDGITGGYNFQAAWTTAFIAGKLK